MYREASRLPLVGMKMITNFNILFQKKIVYDALDKKNSKGNYPSQSKLDTEMGTRTTHTNIKQIANPIWVGGSSPM